LRLFTVTARTKAGKFGNVILGMKAQIVGKLVFPLTQSLVGKFLNGSTVLTDHEAVAALPSLQAALHKSATG
jgi:hypothetical protein